MMRIARLRIAAGKCVMALCLLDSSGLLAAETPQTSDLSQLSLEELTKVEVTSVSRKDHELFKTPAAVFVITRDDIRRSGVSSLPELLRIVPGMQVAQIYANEWAVSSRGFNGRFVDKMLVLIDGRSIYSEIYSGVYWDQNDLLLENIDRIEVIRGPGGTLWGANAVNGIINIITLKSHETPGSLLIGEAGRLDGEGAARFGGSLGQSLHYQSYMKFLNRNQLVTETGADANDGGRSLRLGARADWVPRSSDAIAVNGDLYQGRGDERVYAGTPSDISISKVRTSGGYVLGRWTHQFAHYDTALQTYYNQENHAEFVGSGREKAFDLDFLIHLPRYKRNEATGGAGYRITTDRIISTPTYFTHEHHSDSLYSMFLEDEFTLVPSKLTLTVGFKLVHNSYTGFELQPEVRGVWTPDQRHSLWASVSRAVRTPSVQERDLHILRPVPSQSPLPTYVLAEGDPAFRSEIVHAYETGYRQAFGSRVSVDIAGFFNQYSRLRTQSQLTPYVVTSPTVAVIVPVIYSNCLKARTDGVEAGLTWTPNHTVRIAGSYSWINVHKTATKPSGTTAGDNWNTPTNTLNLRGTWELARRWSFYTSLYTVGELPKAPTSVSAPVSGYVRADVHVSFKVNERLQITAGGDNLQRSRHVEFDAGDDGFSVGSQVPRSAFVKALWSF